jgi:plastocyanin
MRAGATLLLAALVGLGACGGPPSDDPQPHDALVLDDAASLDAAPADAAGPPDALGPCAASYAGCASYADRTGEATVTITASDDVYDPPCIRVTAGTQVTIGASDSHPLAAAPCSPDDFVGAPASGIATTGSYPVATAGIYGYWCTAHGTPSGAGMAGAIQVVP